MYARPSDSPQPAVRYAGRRQPAPAGKRQERTPCTAWEVGADRPRERLARLGAGALTTAELLAVLLGTGAPGRAAPGLAAALLDELGGLGGLVRAEHDALCGHAGIGAAKAARLLAAVELAHRIATVTPAARALVRGPEDAAALLAPELRGLAHEQVRVLLLDSRGRAIRHVEVARGGSDGAAVKMSDVLRPAVIARAASVVLAHNHPTGDPEPSAEDIAFTRAAVQAGRQLGIAVVDHLVIGTPAYVPLRALGVGFEDDPTRSAPRTRPKVSPRRPERPRRAPG